jgi:hypothetical protein
MILALILVLGGIAVVVALGWGLVAAGLRAGDQAGGRLRVFRMPAVSGGSAAAGRPERAAPAAGRS